MSNVVVPTEPAIEISVAPSTTPQVVVTPTPQAISVSVAPAQPALVVVPDPVAEATIAVAAQGPKGDPGPSTGFVGGETFVQSSPSATWTINHALGYNPSVTIIDSTNEQVWGNITYPTLNTVVITFSAAFSGTAYLV